MISICIPAYTHVGFTVDAVHSLLRQDADFELVVVEDFDFVDRHRYTAAEIDAARTLLASDRRIKVQRNQKQLPIQDNWNQTVALASRPYVKLMGADDRLVDGGVAALEAMVRAEPDVLFHGHLARVIDEHGQLIRLQRPYNDHSAPIRLTSEQALKQKLRQAARFKEPACNLYKKVAWQSVGGYSRDLRFCFDVAFNVELMSRGQCCLWNVYAAELRRHVASDGATLPAGLALVELGRLVESVYAKLGSRRDRQDEAFGQAWLMYRGLELAVARYRRQPLEILKFLWTHRAVFLPQHWAAFGILAETLIRRVRTGDVQRLLKVGS